VKIHLVQWFLEPAVHEVLEEDLYSGFMTCEQDYSSRTIKSVTNFQLLNDKVNCDICTNTKWNLRSCVS
jgi:hypothetical protein